MNKIYPYFSFDQYSFTSQPEKWRVIELENPYIKVFIDPQFGGKVLGAVEKSTAGSSQGYSFDLESNFMLIEKMTKQLNRAC